MGSSLSKPVFDKAYRAQGERGRFRWGASAMQGWSKHMEDRFAATSKKTWRYFDKWAFFGIFDGHGGAKASDICSEHLIGTIVDTVTEKLKSNKADELVSNLQTVTLGREKQPQSAQTALLTTDTLCDCIRDGYLKMDEILKTKMAEQTFTGQQLKRLSNDGKHQAQHQDEDDNEQEEQQTEKSGSTAVCAFLSDTHIFIANCGDSRAVLVLDGKIIQTKDHKPNNEEERKRIEAAGGFVINQRVNGVLAVARSLGDFDFKETPNLRPDQQILSPMPDVETYPRNGKDEELLILGCDGIWDVMKNEEVVAYVRYLLECTNDIEEVCNRVVETCLYKGSRDNLTVIIIAFKHVAPKYSDEKVQKDKEIDRMVEDEVRKLLTAKSSDGQEYDSVHSLMSVLDQSIPKEKLPPGGGLASKRPIVEKVFNELKPPPRRTSVAENRGNNGNGNSAVVTQQNADQLATKNEQQSVKTGNTKSKNTESTSVKQPEANSDKAVSSSTRQKLPPSSTNSDASSPKQTQNGQVCYIQCVSQVALTDKPQSSQGQAKGRLVRSSWPCDGDAKKESKSNVCQQNTAPSSAVANDQHQSEKNGTERKHASAKSEKASSRKDFPTSSTPHVPTQQSDQVTSIAAINQILTQPTVSDVHKASSSSSEKTSKHKQSSRLSNNDT